MTNFTISTNNDDFDMTDEATPVENALRNINVPRLVKPHKNIKLTQIRFNRKQRNMILETALKIKNSLLRNGLDTAPLQIAMHLLFHLLERCQLAHKFDLVSKNYIISPRIYKVLDNCLPSKLTLEEIISVYEYLLDAETKSKKGITFTPEFITRYMCQISLRDQNFDDIKIIDPGCGGGIFLLSALRYIQQKTSKNTRQILNENLFGIDLVNENVSISDAILKTQCVLEQPDSEEEIVTHIACADSLITNWSELFNVEFDLVIGNPPYVNPHDLAKNTVEILKTNFTTTKTGTTNIFYAFVEKGMQMINCTGQLCFIVPNNFITINAAKHFRSFLTSNQYLSYIVDFTDNMLFAPVRTYNAIICLDKSPKTELKYSVISKSINVENDLYTTTQNSIAYSKLDDEHRWVLLSEEELTNISKIESQFFSIKNNIKTGIATLKDESYLIDKSSNGKYFKKVNGDVYEIEPGIVKPIYKISDINPNIPIEESRKYIIFPYKFNENTQKNELISETDFAESYPQAYAYLKTQREVLSMRDKGKAIPGGWYAYGRTQGINFRGEKIVYPTFSNSPKFQKVPDAESLFCNGYAIFEDSYLPLDILLLILNSSIMNYYVQKTSYPIEGGYVCYQKKYIERFTIPYLSHEEQDNLRSLPSQTLVDKFLLEKYDLPTLAL